MNTNMGEKPRKILLFIHMVTVAQKTLDGVIEKFPGSKITLLLRYDSRREHIQNNPNIEDIILYKNVALNPLDLFKGRFDFIKKVREKEFDVVIIPDKRLKSYIFSLFARSSEKLVYDVDRLEWEKVNFWDLFFVIARRILAALFGPVFFVFILLITLIWGGCRLLRYGILKK